MKQTLLFNLGSVLARWSSIKYMVEVESSASETKVMKVLDVAHKQSHVRGDFEHPFTIEREIEIKKTNPVG